MTEPTETARELLWRHQLPEDVIDGALCLHAQELAAVQRRDAAVWGVDTAAGKHILAAADLIDPTNGARAAVSAVPAPATDQAALRDRIRRVLARTDGFDFESLEPHDYQIQATAILAVLPAPVEEHRLALSEALGLGTGAPWDAIHDRATELGLPPLDQDPVARRLGLVAEHRAAVLREAVDAITEVIEADRAYSPRRSNDRAALGGAREIVLKLIDKQAAESAPADTGHDDSEPEGEAPCCSDPTCACIQVNAAGRCECARWDAGQPTDEQPGAAQQPKEPRP